MAEEPQVVASNEWGAITLYPEWKTLELKWSKKTRSMSDGGFKETLQMLADQGLKLRPSYMIIDATEFFHQLGDGTLAWRDEHIVPLYNQAGIKKFAFLATDRMSKTSSPRAALAGERDHRHPVDWGDSVSIYTVDPNGILVEFSCTRGSFTTAEDRASAPGRLTAERPSFDPSPDAEFFAPLAGVQR